MVVWIDVVGTNKFHSNRDKPVDDLSDTVSNLWNTLGPATDESFSIQYWEESLPVNPNTCAVPTRHKRATKNLENGNNSIPLPYYASDFWLVVDHCKGKILQGASGQAWAGTAGIRTYKENKSLDDLDTHGHVAIVDFQAFNGIGVGSGPIQNIFQVCAHEVAHGFGAAHWDSMSHNGNDNKATLMYNGEYNYDQGQYESGLDPSEYVNNPNEVVSEFSSETIKWIDFRMSGINDYSHTPVDKIQHEENAKFDGFDDDLFNGERSTKKGEENIDNMEDARGG